MMQRNLSSQVVSNNATLCTIPVGTLCNQCECHWVKFFVIALALFSSKVIDPLSATIGVGLPLGIGLVTSALIPRRRSSISTTDGFSFRAIFALVTFQSTLPASREYESSSRLSSLCIASSEPDIALWSRCSMVGVETVRCCSSSRERH